MRRRLCRRRCADRRSGQSDLAPIKAHGRARRAASLPPNGAARDPLAGAAGLHPRAAGAAGAALLPGRDAGVRTRGRTRDQARALHRRLRRSAHGRCRAAYAAFLESLRLPDPADGATRAPSLPRSASISAWSLRSASPTRLAELCERIGADWSDIAPALKLDKRIGPGAYLSPGLGIAGGNLERDLRTIVQHRRGEKDRCRRGREPGSPTRRIARTGLAGAAGPQCLKRQAGRQDRGARAGL